MLRPGLSWGTTTPATASADTAASRYLNDRLENASPAELTNMLYTEALRCIDTAAGLMDEEKFLDAIAPVVKAQRIVTELRTSLNPDAGDIAITLDSVYAWVYKNLVDANTRRDPKCLAEARKCLAELAEAWAQIYRTA